MAGSRQQVRRETTERFPIEKSTWERFKAIRGIEISWFIPHLFEHYAQGLNEYTQFVKNSIWANAEAAEEFLIKEIQERNTLQRNGTIPPIRRFIDIPGQFYFFKHIFPKYAILRRDAEPIKVYRIKPLPKFNHNQQLVNIVRNNEEISVFDLADDAREQIDKALHSFRIYTARSVYDETVYSLAQEAIKVFQREYMELEDDYANGKLDSTTVWIMHKALVDNWQRESFFRNARTERYQIDSNPYLGLVISGRRVVDNPGFAPYVGVRSGMALAGTGGFARVSSGFNVDAAGTIHDGIDFFAPWLGLTPIHSFIYGEVVHVNDRGDEGFGKHMVIQNASNRRQFFVLAHLDRDTHPPLPQGSSVTPGMTVAHVSNTGNVWSGRRRVETAEERAEGRGTHLHLQLVIADRKEDFITTDGGLGVLRPRSYDPFNHSRPYSARE